MKDYKSLLGGGDLRSIGKSNEVAVTVQNQNEFDELFQYIKDQDRILVMRAADAIEKITIKHPEFLNPQNLKLLN